MITDRIEWPRRFGPQQADASVEATAKIEGLTSEQVWPYLINLSDWRRYGGEIDSTMFIDPSISDPHLFPKVQMAYRVADYTVVARVLEAIPPKGDRPGRISWEGVMRRDGSDEKIDFVHACVLGVESGNNAELTSAILYQGAVSDSERDKLDHANAAWCEGLIKYVADHELHTNHPRQPSTGAMVP